MRDPRVRVQGRDNGRSLSACYWPIVADEREPERALPSAARNDTRSYTASVVTRPFSTGAAGTNDVGTPYVHIPNVSHRALATRLIKDAAEVSFTSGIRYARKDAAALQYNTRSDIDYGISSSLVVLRGMLT